MTVEEAETALPAAISAHEASIAELVAAKALVPEGDAGEPSPEVRARLTAAYAGHARTSQARVDAEARVAAERTLFGLS